jgi:hypothetical protein
MSSQTGAARSPTGQSSSAHNVSRRQHHQRRLNRTASVLLIVSVAPLAGCVLDSAGRPLGADAAHSLSRYVGISSDSGYHHHHDGDGAYCVDGSCEGDYEDTYEHTGGGFEDGEWVREPFENENLGDFSEPLVAEDSQPRLEEPPIAMDETHVAIPIEPACDSTIVATNISDGEALPAHGPGALPLDPYGAMLSLASLPASAIGGIFHAWVPAAAIGPTELPPPSRFHPVPTRPVFAPRGPR